MVARAQIPGISCPAGLKKPVGARFWALACPGGANVPEIAGVPGSGGVTQPGV